MTPFIMLPKNIFNLELSSDALLVYMQMLDAYKLSYQNNWIDDNGIFLYYSISHIEKSRGCSRPTATNILKELEKNGYIIKKTQKGKPTKIYLVRNEFTEFILDNTKKSKNRKIININEKSKQEKEEIDIEIIETFRRYIGREPDKAFKKTILKRIKDGLNIKTVIAAIEKADKVNAKNAEAFILYLTQFNQNNEIETKPLEDWEIEWAEDFQRRKEKREKQKTEQIEELEWYLEIAEHEGNKELAEEYRTRLNNLKGDITGVEPRKATL